MKIPNKKVSEEVDNIAWWWLLTDKWFRLLEMAMLIGVLFYFAFDLDCLFLKLFAGISFVIYCLFGVELVASMFRIIAIQKHIGIQKKFRFLWYVLAGVIVAFVILTILSAAMILADINLSF